MRFFLPLMAITLLFSCGSPNTPHQEDATQRAKDSLSAALRTIHAEGIINGFAVGVVDQEGIIYTEGFGYADVEKQLPYTAATVQNIASISKTLIGISLLKAQELGHLSVDDPVSKHLDFPVVNPHFPDQEITLRHLATHTSSIMDGDVYDEQSYLLLTEVDSTGTKKMEIPEEFNSPREAPMGNFLEKVLSPAGSWYSPDNFMQQPPGQLFEYTNIGATLAAYVIERASGVPYDEFTTRHILRPLGMTGSGWAYEAVGENHSILYAEGDTKLPPYRLITYPDGGLRTSSEDLSKYLKELIRGYAGSGTLLSQESYREFFRKQLSEENFTERNADHPYNDEYDFGLFIGFSAKGYAGHTGGDPGVSSLMFFHEERKVGRLLIINTDLRSEEGVKQFINIWETLEGYEARLK
ncbi:serine hydrolase [Lewinella sp. W8]|uniref:serine hydrolase domain-containing protein n=1 Tax=Lewinella sp. W8 TaxID=2528208 RepID=UPI0010679375|nr:serine hydrolase domain-containing protein [Lewinella sp. W8]MTB52062.1 serine hydrolase [Lewinella sp. W8]